MMEVWIQSWDRCDDKSLESIRSFEIIYEMNF